MIYMTVGNSKINSTNNSTNTYCVHIIVVGPLQIQKWIRCESRPPGTYSPSEDIRNVYK